MIIGGNLKVTGKGLRGILDPLQDPLLLTVDANTWFPSQGYVEKEIPTELGPGVTIDGNLVVKGNIVAEGLYSTGNRRRLEEETDELRDTVAQLRLDLQAQGAALDGATAALQAQGAALAAATAALQAQGAALRAHGLLGAAA